MCLKPNDLFLKKKNWLIIFKSHQECPMSCPCYNSYFSVPYTYDQSQDTRLYLPKKIIVAMPEFVSKTK